MIIVLFIETQHHNKTISLTRSHTECTTHGWVTLLSWSFSNKLSRKSWRKICCKVYRKWENVFLLVLRTCRLVAFIVNQIDRFKIYYIRDIDLCTHSVHRQTFKHLHANMTAYKWYSLKILPKNDPWLERSYPWNHKFSQRRHLQKSTGEHYPFTWYTITKTIEIQINERKGNDIILSCRFIQSFESWGVLLPCDYIQGGSSSSTVPSHSIWHDRF